MKARLLFWSVVMIMAFSACEKHQDDSGKVVPMDYGQAASWFKYDAAPTKEVDVFYILPTCILEGENNVEYFSTESDMNLAVKQYDINAKTLEGFTNVFAPFYRQVPLNIASTLKSPEAMMQLVRSEAGKDDIFAALDYYFEKLNGGRPYIFASHSQGTSMMRIVLDEYMKSHPDHYSKMVASYALGFSLPNEWFAANPHVKKATDESGTGVVIGWNLEGPGATESSLLITDDDYMINPLTWSTSSAYAPASLNHGTLIDGDVVTPGIADAQINNDRSALICTTLTSYAAVPVFGDKSLHSMDWGAFWINIRENARKRCETYLGHQLAE